MILSTVRKSNLEMLSSVRKLSSNDSCTPKKVASSAKDYRIAGPSQCTFGTCMSPCRHRDESSDEQ